MNTKTAEVDSQQMAPDFGIPQEISTASNGLSQLKSFGRAAHFSIQEQPLSRHRLVVQTQCSGCAATEFLLVKLAYPAIVQHLAVLAACL